MVENSHQLKGWPRTDGRLDPVFAMGTSIALHLLALLLLLVGGPSSGSLAMSTAQGPSSASLSALDASEFRQRLVLVSLSRPSKQSPRAAEEENNPLPVEQGAYPPPLLEQSLDAKIEATTKQDRAADSTKDRATADASK